MLFDEIEFNDFSPINLFIGENDTGKTSVLKVLYSIASGIELYSDRVRIGFNSSEYNPGAEMIVKLEGIFLDNNSDNRKLIKINNDNFSIKCKVESNDDNEISEIIFSYSFKPDGIRYNYDYKPAGKTYNFNAVFIPPKEVLSIKDSIKYSKQIGKLYGFDDSYLDLINFVEIPKKIENNNKLDVFNKNKKYAWYDGIVSIIEENGSKRAVFIKNDIKFEIGHVAEGIKKLGIFPVLEKSGHLTKKTILFIDEPENSLHPKALRELMRFFYDISKEGVQIFIASHNQFVVQQLRNIAKINNYSINCYSLLKENEKIICNMFDLKDEMAENPILDAAIKMFDESVMNG
jgi:AAA15 family ATPase/GTPase